MWATCIDIIGVLTRDESDLSFVFEDEGTSSASVFLIFKGNMLALIFCRLWSGLHLHQGFLGKLMVKSNRTGKPRL